MDLSPTDYKHVGIDEHGAARIEGTPYKVRILIAQWMSWDLSPEALCKQHEGLSLSQLYSALAYYLDHKDELDAEIERRKTEAETLRREFEDSELQERLRQAHETRTAPEAE